MWHRTEHFATIMSSKQSRGGGTVTMAVLQMKKVGHGELSAQLASSGAPAQGPGSDSQVINQNDNFMPGKDPKDKPNTRQKSPNE